MKYFICRPCEQKYPKRQANIFSRKSQLRKHLFKEHDIRHNSRSQVVKKPSVGIYKCRCINAVQENGEPKYFIEKEMI